MGIGNFLEVFQDFLAFGGATVNAKSNEHRDSKPRSYKDQWKNEVRIAPTDEPEYTNGNRKKPN
jgi:hypothetical protein